MISKVLGTQADHRAQGIIRARSRGRHGHEQRDAHVRGQGRRARIASSIANNLAARYALIVGEDETKSRSHALRDMASGEQQNLSEQDLIRTLKL